MLYNHCTLPVMDAFVIKRRMETLLNIVGREKYRYGINILYEIINNLKQVNISSDISADDIEFLIRYITLIIEDIKNGERAENKIKQSVLETITFLENLIDRE